MGSLLAFVGGLVVAFLMAAYRGLLLSTFWTWFVMPVFKGAPYIGVAAAVGISLLVGVLTHQQNSEDAKRGFGPSLLLGFVSTTIYFGIGWVITWFL